MKRLCALLSSIILTTHIGGVPANPTPFLHTLPDGSTVQLRLVGDENFHYYLLPDGRKCLDLNDLCSVEASEEMVHHEQEFINRNRRSHIKGLQKPATHPTPFSPRRESEGGRSPAASRGLIILVNYNDVKMENTAHEVWRLMNEEGYSENGATGSARDYFAAQSTGQYLPQFDVVGPIELDYSRQYYGGNKTDGDDRNPHEMIFEATSKAHDQGLINAADYDHDGDGFIDMVYIIFAGLGEADRGPRESIWPFMDDMQTVAQFAYREIGGKRLSIVACSAERRGDGSFSGIGTFCHEFGHCLGLPDLYDVDYSGGFGMGRWDIMSSGSYLNNGNTPPSYTAFERYSLGWLQYEDLTEDAHILLPNLATSNRALRMTTTNPNEYFTIETRLMEGWDSYLPGQGLMICHIDYDEEVWAMNVVNDDPLHQHVNLICADNIWNSSTMGGDLFPGTFNNTSFSDTSRPSSVLWDGTPLQQSISNIALDKKVMVFDYHTDATTAIQNLDFNRPMSPPATVYDLTGRKVAELPQPPETITHTSPLNTLTPGVYIAKGRKWVVR